MEAIVYMALTLIALAVVMKSKELGQILATCAKLAIGGFLLVVLLQHGYDKVHEMRSDSAERR